ncbi:UNVERIFIED_CONTAM: hypothetical protein ACS92_03720 [Bacillus cereus]
MATTYATAANKQVTPSRLRKFESITPTLLEPQIVPLVMYNNQLAMISKVLAPHTRRLAALPKKVLELDEMLFSYLHAPLAPAHNPSHTYEVAGKPIPDTLPVSPDAYSSIIQTGVKERSFYLAHHVR